MGQYRKKPVVIEARSLDGANGPCDEVPTLYWLENLAKWCGGDLVLGPTGMPDCILIRTPEGVMRADVNYDNPSDWVICGVQGEFYPCKPDIFAATYEEV